MVEEPGRRIVQEQTRIGGNDLPWIDMRAFLHQAIELALNDYENASRSNSQWTFFDRSLIDAAAALQELTGKPVLNELGQKYRYHPHVFLTPPWVEIYVQDAERRHDMDAALAEFDRSTPSWHWPIWKR